MKPKEGRPNLLFDWGWYEEMGYHFFGIGYFSPAC